VFSERDGMRQNPILFGWDWNLQTIGTREGFWILREIPYLVGGFSPVQKY